MFIVLIAQVWGLWQNLATHSLRYRKKASKPSPNSCLRYRDLADNELLLRLTLLEPAIIKAIPAGQQTTGVQALKFLMAQHGIMQSDLPEIGSQGVVSEILTGKHELNLRQVRALRERFGVSAATFI